MKKVFNGIIFALAMSLFMVAGQQVNAKTIQKKVVVFEKATRSVSMISSDVEKFKVKGKKYVKAKAKSYQIIVTGKKKGNAVITFKLPGEKTYYKIKVKVLSAKKVKAQSKTKLKNYLKKTEKDTKYIYADLNKDGIQELCLSNKIVYYDYAKNKLCTVKHDFKTIYTSKKSKKIYVLFQNPEITKEFTYFSGIYTFDTFKVFKLKDTGKGFREYTEEGKNVYQAQNPYSFYDTFYDQDDYEYISLTEEQMNEKLEKLVPGVTELKWKTKK